MKNKFLKIIKNQRKRNIVTTAKTMKNYKTQINKKLLIFPIKNDNLVHN